MRSCSRPMPVEAFASAASARMTNGTNGQERKQMSEAKRRQRQLSHSAGPYGPRPRPSTERRTSIGVPPRFSPQGVFHRKGLSLRPGFLGRGGTRFAYPLSGRYPPRPATRAPVIVPRGLMPKAARARVASPPAGTALARAAKECLPGRVRLGEVRNLCNRNRDDGQRLCLRISDDNFSLVPE